MAMSVGMVGSIGLSAASSSSIGGRRRPGEVVCVASGSLKDQYKTLKVQPGSSEKEVKKAFRKLALQYHPDVCKGKNCSVQFHRINDAYDMILNSLRLPDEKEQWQCGEGDEYDDEPTEWELWEEWMGWEGAGIRDYSSHINPYI